MPMFELNGKIPTTQLLLQNPHLLIYPFLSTAVAHQGLLLTDVVHWLCILPFLIKHHKNDDYKMIT